MNLGERRVHHQDQANRNGDVGRADGDRVVKSFDAGGKEESKPHTHCHGEKNPEREIPVEEGESPAGFDFLSHSMSFITQETKMPSLKNFRLLRATFLKAHLLARWLLRQVWGSVRRTPIFR